MLLINNNSYCAYIKILIIIFYLGIPLGVTWAPRTKVINYYFLSGPPSRGNLAPLGLSGQEITQSGVGLNKHES